MPNGIQIERDNARQVRPADIQPVSPGPSTRESASSGANESMLRRAWQLIYRFVKGIGLVTVYHSSIDVKLILIQRFVRVFAFGLVSLLLAAYLAALDITETQIGMFFALTLVGDLVIVMILTQVADVLGRKVILIIGAVSMSMSGIVFVLSDNYWVLLPAAVLGVISPSATEVGPFRTIEESALFTLVTHDLVDVVSWYSTAEFSALALGLVISGVIMDHLHQIRGWDFVSACRVIFFLYGAIGVLKIILSSCMSSKIEIWYDLPAGEQQSAQQATAPIQQVSTTEAGTVLENTPLLQPPRTVASASSSVSGDDAPYRKSKVSSILSSGLLNSVFSLNRAEWSVLGKLLFLMGLDACAIGMSSVPWQTYYVRISFEVSDGPLGLIFFGANILAALGTVSSGALVRRMGNIVTLAVTYVPAAIVFMIFGLPQTLNWMLVVITFEAFLDPIYIAPRDTFVSRVLTKEKRTASLGIINMVKLITNASGSFFTGFMADRQMFWVAFLVSGGLRIVYCLGFLFFFLAVDRGIEREMQAKEDTGAGEEET